MAILSIVKTKCRQWASPLLNATPKQRLHWLLWTVVLSTLSVGAEVWFYNNYRIAWDRQILRCIDARFLLVDLKEKEVERDKLYAYTSKQSAPIIADGSLVGKYVRGVPGDMIEIHDDDTVWINGQKVAAGMPHLRGMTEQQKKKFYGSRVLKDGEYWMMGTKYLSFDSRYWGPIKEDQIVARAYVIF